MSGLFFCPRRVRRVEGCTAFSLGTLSGAPLERYQAAGAGTGLPAMAAGFCNAALALLASCGDS